MSPWPIVGWILVTGLPPAFAFLVVTLAAMGVTEVRTAWRNRGL